MDHTTTIVKVKYIGFGFIQNQLPMDISLILTVLGCHGMKIMK